MIESGQTQILLNVELDSIDRNIIEISQNVNRYLKVSQFQIILEERGIVLSSAFISRKLHDLYVLTLLSRQKRGRYFYYQLRNKD
jgi:hypothetical protein